jgi:hypothetical protein
MTENTTQQGHTEPEIRTTVLTYRPLYLKTLICSSTAREMRIVHYVTVALRM